MLGLVSTLTLAVEFDTLITPKCNCKSNKNRLQQRGCESKNKTEKLLL